MRFNDDLDRDLDRVIAHDDDRKEQETWNLIKRLMKRGPLLTKRQRGEYLLALVRLIGKP